MNVKSQIREPYLSLGVSWVTMLIGHLEEHPFGELLDVVAIAHPVITQDVAVVPKLLNDT